MNTRYSLIGAAFLILVLTVSWTNGLLAQRYVDIPCGYGTIREVLTADSLNRAADPTTVYCLHRGSVDSVYILDASLDWGPMQLNIISTGTGVLPTIIPATLSDGTPFSPVINLKANLYMKGVYIDALNTLGAYSLRVFHTKADSITVRLDSCQITNGDQSFIRVLSQNVRIFLRDCRISNLAQDWSNARGIDNRGVTIDTLSVVNCSFFRVGSRIYRDGNGILNYGYFDHNTFVDVGGTTFQMGLTSNLAFTNNLLVNCGFLGHNISGAGTLVDVTPIPEGQSAYISNNVFCTDSAKLYAAFHAYSDSVTFFDWFSDTLITFMENAGTTNTNIGSSVTFAKAPGDVPDALPVDSITRMYWFGPPVGGVGNGDASMLRIGSPGLVNLAYNWDAPAYTWGSDGKQVGSLEWFTRKEAYSFPSGWNLLSVPHTSENRSKLFLFPTAVSQAFAYEGSYVQKESLSCGVGYWLKFSGPQSIPMTGMERIEDSISVVTGWNMVGSISYPVPTSSITSNPEGMSTSEFFAYSMGYVIKDTIEPGRGYWVKVNQTGKLFLSSSGTALPKNRIRIVPTGELPPAPPVEMSPKGPLPKEYSLEQCYPNPFNPSTVISYSLPVGGRVTLVVYNTLGQQLATLVNAEQDAGSYTVRWNGVTDRGAKVASGIYFYQLRAATFVSTKKMMFAQ